MSVLTLFSNLTRARGFQQMVPAVIQLTRIQKKVDSCGNEKSDCCNDWACKREKKCASFPEFLRDANQKKKICADLKKPKIKREFKSMWGDYMCDAESKKPRKPFQQFWDIPKECCLPCEEALPRFDELYWQPSDKKKRRYQQTWAECAQQRIIPKLKCCFERIHIPPYEKRPADCCPKTACPQMPNCRLPLDCPRLNMPCCRKSARYPPKCKKNRGFTDCVKDKCPYPAFSECKKPPANPRRPQECFCQDSIALCEFFNVMRYRRAFGIKPNLYRH